MIITVTLNPAVDKTLIVPGFTIDSVNRVEDIRLDPGGKGINVAKSVRALGGDPLCLGIVGGSTGDYICSALEECGLRHSMTRSARTTRTNTKIVDMKLHTNTDVNEPGAPVTLDLLEDVWKKLALAAKAGDIVVIAGKNPPGVPDDLLAQWVRELRNRDVCVCLDTIGRSMEMAMLEKPNIIKPNVEELSALTGKKLMDINQIVRTAAELVDIGIELVAVSMGADGAVFVTKDKIVRARCPKVTVVSTVGAGDSMMAALAYYSPKELPLEQLARRAVAVATATVQIRGSQPAELPLIEQMLKLVQVEIL